MLQHQWHRGTTDYEYNMQSMTQRNPDSGTVREIRQVIIIPDDAPPGFAEAILLAAGL